MNYIYESTHKKENKNTGRCILYALTILPFLSLSAIKSTISATAYQQWQIVSICILFCAVITLARNTKIDSFISCLVAYEALTIAVLSYRHGFSPGIAVVSAAFVLLTILINTDSKAILKTLAIISVLIIIANGISLIGSPIDENKEYFIGGKNSFSMTLIPAMGFYTIYILNKYDKLRFIDRLVLLCAAAQIFYGKSGTGIICICIALFMFVSNKAIKNKKIFILAIIALNILFLLAFTYISKMPLWEDITKWLDKSSTLTGRTTIWELAIKNIKEHWIIGNGRGIELFYINSIGEKQNLFEAHNIFLQVLMCNGVVGFIIYIKYLLKAINKLDIGIPQQKVLFIAIFVCLINGLTESNGDNTLFRLLIAFAYYANSLKEEKNEKIKTQLN